MRAHAIDHQPISRLQPNCFLAHSYIDPSIQRKKHFQPFVPGDSAREPARSEMKETDRKRKFPVQRKVVASGFIEPRLDVVTTKLQPRRHLQQPSPGSFHLGARMFKRALPRNNSLVARSLRSAILRP